jgi:hypothetical protein
MPWGLVFKIVIAVGAALVLYWIGAAFVRNLASAPPPDDEPRPLLPVDIRYECLVCGAEVTMTLAPDGELPSAPRHCMEPMHLVADATSE